MNFRSKFNTIRDILKTRRVEVVSTLLHFYLLVHVFMFIGVGSYTLIYMFGIYLGIILFLPYFILGVVAFFYDDSGNEYLVYWFMLILILMLLKLFLL